MDGVPTGRVKVTLANWTGVPYRVPRVDLNKCNGIAALTQSDVYFLFGTVEESGGDVVYVGQAGVRKNGEGILYRLKEHMRNPDKDYWTEAVVFTTSNNSFGPTEISYLENRFCALALNAKRYAVKNGNDPSPGHITEEKESELEEFLDYAKIIMGALGHKVFEPLLQTAPIAPSADGSVSETGTLFAINRTGANAKGMLTNEGFVVLAGSVIRQELVPSASDSIKASRENNKENVDMNGVVQKDILFRTPSGASSFALGAPTNGNVEWKTAEGQTLKEVENSGNSA
jgi:hypothetical protein